MKKWGVDVNQFWPMSGSDIIIRDSTPDDNGEGNILMIVGMNQVNPDIKAGISEEDAYLIAAAPELLTACENALRDIQKINAEMIADGKNGYILMENELNNAINIAYGRYDVLNIQSASN